MRLFLTAVFFAAAAIDACIGAAVVSDHEPQSVHPILIVPGALGNQIEGRLNKTEVTRWWCFKDWNWYTLWFDPIQFIPGIVDCWVDNFRMDAEEDTGRPLNRPGVEVRVPGFGDTETVEYLNPIRFFYGYMNKLVQSLVSIGYVRGKTVRAAPYDFRLAPVDNPEYLESVKELVETMYKEAGEKSVILFSHSTGSRYLYYFLTQQTPEWKAKYVARWVSVAGSLGGDVPSLSCLSAGVFGGRQGLSKDTVRTLFRSWSSFAFGSPDPLAFNDTVVLSWHGKDYTAADLKTIFQTIGHVAGVKQLERTKNLIQNFDDPGVPVTCFRGTGIDTISRIIFVEDPQIVDGLIIESNNAGDGNVNVQSSRVCERWSQSPGFESREFDAIQHIDLLRDGRVLSRIAETVNRLNEQQ